VRTPEANFNIANFVKSQIYSAFATYKYGMDKLLKEEHIQAKNFYASGGIFKTEGVAELYLASAVNTPITLMKTANEGGSYGMALLAMYAIDNELSLNDYLNQKVFKDVESRTTNPDLSLVEGFNKFEEKYIAALKIEKEADNWGN
jgi:sugar (pentulose or hexulose) kinase